MKAAHEVMLMVANLVVALEFAKKTDRRAVKTIQTKIELGLDKKDSLTNALRT